MGRFNQTVRTKTARFAKLGASVSGTVQAVVDLPAPEFNDEGRVIGPKFDVNGTIVEQPDITIETDDGEQYVIHAGIGVQVAIGAALEEIGAADLVPGDHLTVTWEHSEANDDSEDGREINPTKVYSAVVIPAKSAKK
jgi:hypothetical protein